MTETVTSQAIRYASVTGYFEPRQIADALGLGDGAAGYREALWRELSQKVMEGVCTGRYGWELNAASRRAALSEFFSLGQLEQTLSVAPQPWAEDLFGRTLQTVLRQRRPQPPTPVDTENGETEVGRLLNHYGALLDAAQFAEAVPALDRSWLEETKRAAEREIQMLQRRRDLETVLPRRHFGYSGYLRRLSRFLRAETEDGRPVLLTGLGGVGKSALVARLLRTWLRREGAPVMVILDFDRRQLNGGEPVEIMQEFLRQLIAGIGLRHHQANPTTNEVLDRLWEMCQSLPKFTASGDQRTHESQLSYTLSATLPHFSKPWAVAVRDLNIAMIFDSFEGVDRQGGFVVEQILNLEAELRAAGLGRLRTAVSGREPPLPEEAVVRYFGPQARRIRLHGLSEISGARLLEEEDARFAVDTTPSGISAEHRRQVSRILGGHPLALIVFARYARRHPDEVDQMVEQLGADDGAFQAEFAQSFLYERILDRIDDPVAGKLAHPGLVLRQLSSDLIRFVLAGPCLGQAPDELSEHDADRMLASLRDEYWLVEDREPPFPLRHRPDLRRLMLKGVFSGPRPTDPPEAAERKSRLRQDAVAVCAGAAEYFATGPAAGDAEAMARWRQIDVEDRRVEALYYRALADPASEPSFEAEMAARMDIVLGEDLETLPVAWRARVKALLGQFVSEGEAATLRGELREAVESRRFSAAQKSGFATRKERRAPRVDGDLANGPASASAEELEREILRGFDQAAFDALPQLAAAYLRALRDRSDEEAERRFWASESEGYWRHPLWRCILLAGTNLPGVEAMAEAAYGERRPIYRHVFNAVRAAVEGDDRKVQEHLLKVLSRSSRSPIDINRVRGLQAAGLLRWRPELGFRRVEKADFHPAALCLLAHPPRETILSIRGLHMPLERQKISLDKIGRLYSKARSSGLLGFVLEDLAPDLFPVLRGLNPELQPPLISMLSQLPGKDAVWLTQELAQHAPSWPTELWFSSEQEFRYSHASIIVETADQAGKLGELAKSLHRYRPEAGVVARMHQQIGSWLFPFPTEQA